MLPAAAVMEAALRGKIRKRLWELHEAPHKRIENTLEKSLMSPKKQLIMRRGEGLSPNSKGEREKGEGGRGGGGGRREGTMTSPVLSCKKSWQRQNQGYVRKVMGP